MQKLTVGVATVTKNGVVQQVGRSVICKPKTNFKGTSNSMTWYEASQKKEIEVKVLGNQLEIHIPDIIESSRTDSIINRCLDNYLWFYGISRDKVSYDFKVIYPLGYICPDFKMNIHVWQESESGQRIQETSYIEKASRDIQNIVWDKIGDIIKLLTKIEKAEYVY